MYHALKAEAGTANGGGGSEGGRGLKESRGSLPRREVGAGPVQPPGWAERSGVLRELQEFWPLGHSE